VQPLNESNKLLFNEQVKDHIEKLNGLMTLASGEAIEAGSIRKACLATKLLEGSTSMLGIEAWSGTLVMFRELLDKSSKSSRCWDEQLSQIVSEVLETEEQVITEILEREVAEIDFSGSFEGLNREMEFLLSECEKAMPPDGADSGIGIKDNAVHLDAECDKSLGGYYLESFSTLDRLIDSLNGVRDRFSMYLEDPERRSDIVRNLELAFGESEFYIDLIGDILSRLGDVDRRFLSKVSCGTVLDGVRDFFYLHKKIKGWNAEFVSRMDDFSLDRDAASALAVILEGCLFDVCKLSGADQKAKLEANVDIRNMGSYLLAKIVDNYSNYLCDSELDMDDVVAFYPSLRNIRNLLEKWGGLLWVEPDPQSGERFRFTLPITGERIGYLTFPASGSKLAVPCHSVECVLSSAEAPVKEDKRGKYLIMSGTRIPVYGLEDLAPDEIETDSTRSYVMIVGVAEKRAGIYTDNEGTRIEGIIDQVTEGEWSSLMKDVLNVGEDEYPILDVRLVLKRIGFLQGFDDNLEEAGTFVADEEVAEEVKEATVPRV
jgi:hypothetical protein